MSWYVYIFLPSDFFGTVCQMSYDDSIGNGRVDNLLLQHEAIF